MNIIQKWAKMFFLNLYVFVRLNNIGFQGFQHEGYVQMLHRRLLVLYKKLYRKLTLLTVVKF